MLLVSSIAMALTLISVFLITVRFFRQDLTHSMTITAKVIGESCVPPMVFSDREGAREVLATVVRYPSIKKAVLFDEKCEKYALYMRTGSEPKIVSCPTTSSSAVLENDQLVIVQPVEHNAITYGKIVLLVSTEELNRKVERLLFILFPLFASILGIVYLISEKLQRLISTPIAKLTGISQHIRRNNDYSVRAETTLDDEIGMLYKGFNTMVEQVHINEKERDSAFKILHDSEKKTRTLIETIPLAVFECSIDGNIVSVNHSFENLTGFSSSELLRKHVSEIVDNIDIHKMRSEFKSTPHHENSARRLIKTTAHRKDGGPVDVQFFWNVNRNENRDIIGMICVLADISNILRLEEQVRQSEKINAIGQLAGGIAHDFNNQLTGIMGFTRLLESKVANDPESKELVDFILKSCKRSTDLTSQLLAFARKGKYLSVPVDLHQTIQEVIAILQRSIDKKIVIEQHLDAAQSITIGDPTQIQNMFLNLGINARDAMPEGGRLEFSTTVADLDEIFISSVPFVIPTGQYIHVTITDTGCGMDAQTQKRIFEPFFTTKERGKGTGMGLAAVYGTVKTHKGAIVVRSFKGKGSTFNVYLPVNQKQTIAAETTKKSIAHSGENAHILVVDDEEIVQKLFPKILSRLSYRVSVCKDGDEAVRYYAEHWEDIDAVIIDMIMPSMGGKETFLEMKKINPEVKAILCSGYTFNGDAQEALENGAVGFVQKPVQYAELIEQLKKCLPQSTANRD